MSIYHRRARFFVLLLCLGMFAGGPVWAETVKLRMPSGLTGLARYVAGDDDKPAVLVLHGFLSSNNFNTVLEISNMLEENGYTVLAPNLTLGIQARKSSLACDAIHTNRLDDDLDEIAQWASWLGKQTGKKIYLIGHSYGSLELLAYIHEYPHTQIAGLITTSLSFVDGFNEAELVKKQVALARARRDKGDAESLHKYSISYCRGNFVAPADVYLSYTRWTERKVLNALANSAIPVLVIMGGADKRFSQKWLDDLQNSGVNLQIIPGASHFFSDMQEFELHEAILAFLDS